MYTRHLPAAPRSLPEKRRRPRIGDRHGEVAAAFLVKAKPWTQLSPYLSTGWIGQPTRRNTAQQEGRVHEDMGGEGAIVKIITGASEARGRARHHVTRLYQILENVN